jgi:radical SAM superfamily enzyme YgiQ (UPF0313 family)
MAILLIQPAITYPEEQIAGRHQSVRQKEGYIEIGLLSIASFLQGREIDVSILNMADPDISLEDLQQAVVIRRPHVIGIACMSGYAYPSLRTYSALIKDLDARIFILTGGQHTAPLGQIVLQEIPQIDCVIRYEGEVLTWQVYNAVVNGTTSLHEIPGIVFRDDNRIVNTEGTLPLFTIDDLPFLNYTLFPNFSQFVPRLEESRGCPFDCWFCSNASVFARKVRYKSAERLIQELCAIHEQYGRPEQFNFYLIAKTYGLDKEITVDFARRVSQLPFKAQWRTQSRADIIDPEILPILSASGLRMLDLGLESASPKMLRLMNKTHDPQEYLRKAEAVIEKAAQLPGTFLKLNLLFHPGETAETLAETLSFLFRWRSQIDAITVSPVMVDPGSPLWHDFPSFERRFGSRLLKNEFWDSIHIYPADPSSELSFESMNTLSALLSKMFQTKENYLLTRIFGGMLPGTDLEKLDQYMQDIPVSLLPYSITS